MSAVGPPPELLYRYWPLYEDAYWRMGYLHRSCPCRLTSLYRDEESNRAVGGAPRSQHLLALAGDWVVSEEYKGQFLQTAAFLGLIAIDEGSHIHVQRYEAGALPAHLFPGE